MKFFSKVLFFDHKNDRKSCLQRIGYICAFNTTSMFQKINLFDLSQPVNYRTEILSGLTVALALVPEAVAFALMQDCLHLRDCTRLL
jgi:hypothetical protein